MRRLNTLDIFTMSKIYSKMDIKLEVTTKTTQMELGAQLINKFIANIHKAQREVIDFLADLKGVDSKEIEQLGFKEFINVINELFEQEGAKDFLQQAIR